MKAGFLLACAASGGALMAHHTTGSPYGVIGIVDEIIRPGQVVRIIAGCDDPAFVRSPVTSPVLSAPALARESSDPVAPFFSSGKIAADAKPGRYPISFTCVDREIKNEFTVVAASEKPGARAPSVTAAGPGSRDPGDGYGVPLVGALTLVAVGGVTVLVLRRRALRNE